MDCPSTPPRGRLRTPPTPLHGPQHDDFAPYSPRRSSRKTLHSNPYSSTNTIANKSYAAQMSTKKPTLGLGYAPSDCFSSPPASPVSAMRKSSSLLPNTPRRLDNSNHNNSAPRNDFLDPSSSVRQPFMLPTPIKTPTMTPARKHSRAASLQETARVLHFQPDDPNDSMPTPQQKRASARGNKYRRVDTDAEQIPGSSRNGNGIFQIYTESQARVPQLDDSQSNPFYRPRANTIPQTGSDSPPLIRKKTAARIEEEEAMHAASRKEKGIVYTFRGRKVFQSFTDSDDNDADTEAEADDLGSTFSQRALKRSAGAAAQRPLTRSQLKGRVLFPLDSRPLDSFTDEEAETDIDLPTEEVQRSHEATKSNSVKFSMPATPAKGRATTSHNTASPPTKARASRKRNAGDIPQDNSAVSESAFGLATPAQSSKKKQKHVDFADIPVYNDDTPGPMSADDDRQDSAVLPSPQSSRKKTRSAPNLTPVVEDEDEGDSPVDSRLRASHGRSTSRSPFDQWPRTKAGLKREGDQISGGVSKRTRSAATP